jgi:hypothetical protein
MDITGSLLLNLYQNSNGFIYYPLPYIALTKNYGDILLFTINNNLLNIKDVIIYQKNNTKIANGKLFLYSPVIENFTFQYNSIEIPPTTTWTFTLYTTGQEKLIQLNVNLTGPVYESDTTKLYINYESQLNDNNTVFILQP